MTDYPILRDKLELWQRQANEGNMDLRDYNRRAALELDALLTLATAYARRETRLREALVRLRDPAPGVRRLPPWVYGIIIPALADATKKDPGTEQREAGNA